MDEVRLDLLGGLDVQMRPGAALPVPARKAAALLAYLALHPGRLQPRERLAALFWEGSAEPQARTSLRQALVLLRRGVPGFSHALCASGDALGLRPGWASTDAAEFEAAAAAGDLAQAATLYRGELLAGMHLRSCAFEAWLLPERERLHGRAVSVMQMLLQEEGGDADQHVALALRLLQLDPALEDVHRALMRLHARRGRHEAALRQYRTCCDALRRELDVAPDAETEQLARDIRARRTAALRPAVPLPAACRPELRYVTVVRAELDRTGLARGDPEALQEAQDALLQAVRAAAELQHGGVVAGGFGTAAAVFGALVARSDDARRGLGAALAIHASSGLARRVRVGVACGPAMLGEAQPDGSLSTLAGEVLDQAGRLAARAGPGQTVASGPIRAAIPDHSWSELDPDGDGPAWRLLNRPAGDAAAVPPFVGRRAELGQFAAVLADLGESGRGRVVMVRGEAGLGKTRLAREFQRLAAADGLRCHAAGFVDSRLHNQCGPVQRLLRSMLDGVADDAAEAAAGRAVANGWVAEGDLGCLRDLLGLPAPDGSATGSDALDHAAREGARREVIGACVRGAGQVPRLLLAEDVHWADEGALAALAAIAAAAPDCRVVLVITTRDANGVCCAAVPVVTLDLGALRQDEAEALAGSLRDAADPLVPGCVARAGGHPLFLEQLLRGDWQEGGSLPATVHSTVLARLDALGPADRVALQAASILGQCFPEAMLRHVLDQPGYACTPLVSQALLRPCRNGLAFAHALVRDAVYDSLPATQRRRWHVRAAGWLENRDPALRAEHLDHAGEHGAAAAAYLAAAQAQAGMGRFDGAERLAGRGLQLAAAGSPSFALGMLRAGALHELGRMEEAAAGFQAALGHASLVAERREAWFGIVAAARVMGNLEMGTVALRHARGLARSPACPPGDRVRADYYEGCQLYAGGEVARCLAVSRRALAGALAWGEPEWVARAYSAVGDARYACGEMRAALRAFEQAALRARERGLHGVEVGGLFMAGAVRRYLLDLDGALADVTGAAGRAAELRRHRIEMHALNLQAELLLERREPEASADALARAFDLCRSLGNGPFRSYLLMTEARRRCSLEQLDEAAALLDEAVGIARRTGLRFLGPKLLGLSARVAALRKRDARALLAEGGRLLQEGEAHAHNVLWFHRDALDACLALGDADAAERHADALAAVCHEDGAALPWAARFAARGHLLARALRGESSLVPELDAPGRLTSAALAFAGASMLA